MLQVIITTSSMMSQDNNQEGGPLHVGDQCEMESCNFQYEALYFHGYSHYGIEGLEEFALGHRSHILKAYDMTSYELKVKKQGYQDCYKYPCRSFNFPLQPNSKITEELLEGYLLRILNTLGTSFKARVGVSRILMSWAPTLTPVLKLYRCEHDQFTQQEVEGAIKKQIRTDRANITEAGLSGLHPYLVDSWGLVNKQHPK